MLVWIYRHTAINLHVYLYGVRHGGVCGWLSMTGILKYLPLLWLCYATQTMAVTAVRANDFLNTMGAATHVIQGLNTPQSVINGIGYLGIRNIRDDASTSSGSPGRLDLCNIHTATGALVDELPVVNSDPNNVSDTQAEWDQLAGCGAYLQAEGPNEPNNFPFTYNGTQCNINTTFLPCAQFQTALYSMVKGDNALKNFPVLGMTSPGAEPNNVGVQWLTIPSGSGLVMPDGTVYADTANIHNYVQGNGSAGTTLENNHARLAETVCSGGPWDLCGEYWGNTWNKGFAGASTGQNDRPKETTETGWNINTANIGQAAQGKLLTDVYLDAYQLGFSHTFVYLMFNDDSGWGFFNVNGDEADAGNATLMGVYTHNLTSILADTSSGFTPNTLPVTVTGLPSTGYSQLFQKSNGSYVLAVWGESFASETSTPITVNLGATYSHVAAYDITQGTTPTASYSNVSSVPLTLNDHALLVQFSSGVQLASQSVGSMLPPISAQFLSSSYGNGTLGQTTVVTNVASPCSQGTTPSYGGATSNICRAVSTGTKWTEVANSQASPTPTPTPAPSGTFSTSFACSTSARAAGGCNFNSVTYGAGGTTLPTLNASNMVTVPCQNNSGDEGRLTTAAGAGGTSNNRKGVQITGTQCDMTSTFFIPPYTDVQCANPQTIIFNPTANNPGYASFEVSGPNNGGVGHDVTQSNCIFNGTNGQPGQNPSFGYGGCTGVGCPGGLPQGSSFPFLIEHASNVTFEDNLVTNTQGQAGVEAICGSSGSPDCSNASMIWNTFDSCALYGATSDNVTNSHIAHNYYKDCRFGNEMESGSTQVGTYFNDYNYIYVHYGVGYYYQWCGGFGGLDGYCTLHRPGTSCEATGNIMDAGGNSQPTCPHNTNEFVNAGGEFTLEGEGGTWSQNYCYNPATSSGCGCDSVGSGCTTGNPPNPAPSGP
jgi:hypothetical protein